jgi:predicted nucleotidyltransferase
MELPKEEHPELKLSQGVQHVIELPRRCST